MISVASNMANDFSMANFQPTKQLDYFSQILGFKVQYSDFPKVCTKFKYKGIVHRDGVNKYLF